MSESTIEKIRAARALRVKVNDMTFIGRRPTFAEYGMQLRSETEDHEAARLAINGWENVRECDLIKGGGQQLVDFEQTLWDEFIVDRPDVWRPITLAIVKAITAAANRSEESEKNLPAG